jgi:hypothetical protein
MILSSKPWWETAGPRRTSRGDHKSLYYRRLRPIDILILLCHTDCVDLHLSLWSCHQMHWRSAMNRDTQGVIGKTMDTQGVIG